MDIEEDASLGMDRAGGTIIRRILGDDEGIGDPDQGVVPQQALGSLPADEKAEVLRRDLPALRLVAGEVEFAGAGVFLIDVRPVQAAALQAVATSS